MKTLKCDYCGKVERGLGWLVLEWFDEVPSVQIIGDPIGPWHFDRMECLAAWALEHRRAA